MTIWQWIICAVIAFLYGFEPWARLAHKDSQRFMFLIHLACGVFATFYIFYGARYLII